MESFVLFNQFYTYESFAEILLENSLKDILAEEKFFLLNQKLMNLLQISFLQETI